METGFHHVPIMVSEVLELLEPARGGIFVDGTLGGGGHAEAVLSALPEGGRLFGIDRDDEALRAAGARLARFGDRFTAIKGNFFRRKRRSTCAWIKARRFRRGPWSTSGPRRN